MLLALRAGPQTVQSRRLRLHRTFMLHSYWTLHEKFAASLVLPMPLYTATCG